MIPKIGKVTYYEKLLPVMLQNPLGVCQVMSYDQLKTLCLHYQNDCGQQTWQHGFMQWRASFHIVMSPLKPEIL